MEKVPADLRREPLGNRAETPRNRFPEEKATQRKLSLVISKMFDIINPNTQAKFIMIKETRSMNMQENFRLIEALQSAGWTAEEIINLIKYVESGEEQYKPKKKQ